MEEEGYIQTYWGDGIGGARRRYYRITPKGLRTLETKKEEWETVSQLLTNLILK